MDRFDFNWNRTDRRAAVVARITLKNADGSDARVINACHLDLADSVQGENWAPALLDLSRIQYPGSLLTNDVQFANCTAKLDGLRRLPWQRAGDTLADIGSLYYWLGSKFEVFFIERDSLEARQIFDGVVAAADIQPDEVGLTLRQRNSWNRSMVPDVASRERYPNCLEDSVGAPLAIKIGRKPGLGMRYPWQNAFANRSAFIADGSDVPPNLIGKNGRARIAGGKRADRAVVVDPGTGPTAPAKVVLAPHKLARIADVNNGAGLYIELDDGTLALIEVPGANVSNTATEASVTLPDGSDIMWVPIQPSSIFNTSNLPDTAQAILDPWNEASLAGFDFANSKDVLEARFPTITAPGTMTRVYFMVGADLNGGALTLRLYINGSLAELQAQLTYDPTDAGHPTWTYYDLGSVWGNNGKLPGAWDFGAVRAFFGNAGRYVSGNSFGAGSGKPKLYQCGFVVRCMPNQAIVESEREVSPARLSITSQPRGGTSIPLFGDGFLNVEPKKILPATTEVRGKLFTNWEGFPDETGNSITNTPGKYAGAIPSTVVTRPCDLARLVLQNWGKEPDDRIASGTAFGSFETARNTLKTWRGLDMELGISIGDTINVQNALQWIMAGSASMVTMSQDGTWRFIPVFAGMPTTYSRKIHRDQLIGPIRASLGPDNRLLTAIRLPYAYNDQDGSYASEIQVAANKSSGGYDYFGMRHAALVCNVNANDRIDVKVGANTATVQVASGSHTYDSLLADFKAKFNASGGTLLGRTWSYGFGGVTTQYNAKGIVQTNLGTFTFTIPNGVRTMEQHAQAAQDAMNSSGSTGWVVLYNRATRKFSINNTADHNTAYVDFGLNFNSTAWNFSAGATLGFAASTVHPLNGTAVTAPIEIDELRFALSCSTSFDLLLRSGANGFLASPIRTAGPLLGYTIFDDRVGGLGYSGQCPKFVIESDLLAVVRRYVDPTATDAARPDTTIDGRAVCHSDTAIEVVNRVAQVLGKAIVSVAIAVEGATDLEIGHVFEFDSDCDADSRYPDPATDRMWAGKRFLVVEFEQNPGPTTFQREVIAVAVGG